MTPFQEEFCGLDCRILSGGLSTLCQYTLSYPISDKTKSVSCARHESVKKIDLKPD